MGSPAGERPLQNDLLATNRTFYEALWSKARLHQPHDFNTWSLVTSLLSASPKRLELGPGLRPRLPIAGTCLVDLSRAATRQLRAHGGLALAGDVGALPFRSEAFDLVSACDVVEHVADDRAVFRELSRVLKDGGVLLLAVPLYRHLWSEFDEWVGHARRYGPSDLLSIFADHGLALEQSAIYGMQPANDRWLRLGMWYLKHRPARAMFWYNWVGMPLAIMFQKPLELVSGLIERPEAAEVLLVCRRERRAHS
jgi:SAM-dependent methyltransferase